MNTTFLIYLSSIIVCMSLNWTFYDKFKEKRDFEKAKYGILYFIFVFLGPISIVINLYYVGVYIKYKINRYLHYRKMEKVLSDVIEEKLLDALEQSGIQVVDK